MKRNAKPAAEYARGLANAALLLESVIGEIARVCGWGPNNPVVDTWYDEDESYCFAAYSVKDVYEVLIEVDIVPDDDQHFIDLPIRLIARRGGAETFTAEANTAAGIADIFNNWIKTLKK